MRLVEDSYREPAEEPVRTPVELEAVRRFALSGSLAQVSRDMGIALYELQKLSRLGWWADELALLRREELALTNATLTRLFDATLGQIEDRLINGDYHLVSGQMRRVALDAKTLARLADVIFDKRQLVRNQPTVIEGDNSKLALLAEKLARLGAKNAGEGRLIEGDQSGAETP